MTGTEIRVLLVEDNRGDARLVERFLERSQAASFEVAVAPLAEKAIALAESRPFDAALVDLSLPDTEPGSLTTLERLLDLHPELALIVLTGRDDDELALEAMRRGAQDFLRKRELTAPLLERALRYALERKQAELALRQSEERYALAVQGANDGIWDWDLEADEIYLSPRWKKFLGFEDEELDNEFATWLGRIHEDDRERFEAELEHHLQGKVPHFQSEIRIRHRDRAFRWMVCRGLSVRDAAGRCTRIAGSLRDITARKRAEEQLQHDALHDALTGLANRALLSDRLEVAIARQPRFEESCFAVLFLDLDRFKNINDSLGHLVGDRLLVALAERLRQIVRPTDTVARVGGDEFAILTGDLSDVKYANRLAERIARQLERPFLIDELEIFASASIGIAISTSGYERPEEMVRDADIAMYRAKLDGDRGYAVFDPAMHESAVALLRLENDLKRALERREFRVHYQPIMSLADDRLIGFEALLRWQHPQRGLVYPDEFVAVAEETGLIVQIGERVLRAACRQMARWRRQARGGAELAISVNLSARQFRQPDLVDQVCLVLEETGLEPEALRLEITEGVIMRDTDGAIRKLMELRALGVQIHIDDFGTGYSSLSYLHRLPTDTVKIDRSFVSGLGDRSESSEIVSTIVALARKLGMQVTAEGLETADQVASLRAMDCEYGQGYFFSEALAAREAEIYLDLAPATLAGPVSESG